MRGGSSALCATFTSRDRDSRPAAIKIPGSSHSHFAPPLRPLFALQEPPARRLELGSNFNFASRCTASNHTYLQINSRILVVYFAGSLFAAAAVSSTPSKFRLPPFRIDLFRPPSPQQKPLLDGLLINPIANPHPLSALNA